MTSVKTVAKLTVEIYADAENLHRAERLLDHWLIDAEDDERLIGYVVAESDWVPEPSALRSLR